MISVLGAEMTPAKDTTNEGKDKGKKKNLNEEKKSPWETYKDMWVKSIKGSSE